MRWDAWDVDRHVLRHPQVLDEVTSRKVIRGRSDAGVEVVRRTGTSTITLTMWLRAGTGRFETECAVDWQERERLLKSPCRCRSAREPHGTRRSTDTSNGRFW